MKLVLLTLLFATSLFSGEVVVTTPAKSYTGAVSTSVVKNSSGKTIATATTVARPSYVGGGTVTTVKSSSTGKTSTITTITKPSYTGGGSKSVVKP